MTLYIGTCGYSYPEWVGPVYPEGTRPDKMLEIYSTMFNAVEIDSTYYRPPSKTMFARYPVRTGGKLKIFMKLHSKFTHERDAERSDADFFAEAIKPIVASGQFSGFLAQFPQSFNGTPANREYLEHLRLLFPETTVVCEFRHEDWWHQDTLAYLAKLNFPVATVDAPDTSTLPPNEVIFTREPGYMRLHGRNVEGWYNKGSDERYTYKYSRAELKDWLKKVRLLVAKSGTVYILFNNHPFGYAAVNATEFIEIIREAMPDAFPGPINPGIAEQQKLF